MTPSERNIAFFRPLWRRVLLLVVLAVWTGVELFWGDRLWAWITGAVLAYSIWEFFIKFPKDEPTAEK